MPHFSSLAGQEVSEKFVWCFCGFQVATVSNLNAIGILPANTRYRLVGNANPHLVENVGQVERAGQKQIRSRASAYKLHICTC